MQEQLESLFNKYGRTNAVRMRRDDAKKFKVDSHNLIYHVA